MDECTEPGADFVNYRTVCSGIEAPTVAWARPLGWTALSFAEIDPFCCALLKRRYPEVINHGDFTAIRAQDCPGSTDLLMGGTPCQSFSVAGRRAGLDDPRGNLALEFIRLAQRLRPRWIVWENVKGVLSSDGGRTFEAFLGALAQCGYGFAYRVLDAQFCGLAQRRERVFVVGYLGDWRPPAAVLFERESLRRDLAPRRKAGEEVAGTIGGRAGEGGQRNDLDNHGAYIPILEAGARQGSKGDVRDGLGIGKPGDPMFTLSGKQHAVAFHGAQITSKANRSRPSEQAPTLNGDPRLTAYTLRQRGRGLADECWQNAQPMGTAVRRLTPMEWERLMGFDDDYTLIPYPREKLAADGPRYKAIGNSIAIPPLRWIGRRIDLVEDVMRTERNGLKQPPHSEIAVPQQTATNQHKGIS